MHSIHYFNVPSTSFTNYIHIHLFLSGKVLQTEWGEIDYNENERKVKVFLL